MGDFAASVQAWAGATGEQIVKVKKEAALEVLTRIVDRSPVGDPETWASKPPPGYVGGRFKANWNASLVEYDDSTTQNVDPDGSVTIARAAAAIAGATADTDIYLCNALPYAQRLEDGWSKQAPVGMVGLTLVEWPDIVNKVKIDNG